jgi:hypothetical protein
MPYVGANLSAADRKMLTGSWSGMLKGPGGRKLGNQELKFLYGIKPLEELLCKRNT